MEKLLWVPPRGDSGLIIPQKNHDVNIKTEKRKRNDPCPRFSSADKGHLHSILVSNILCISSYSTVYLFRFPVKPWNPAFVFRFSNREDWFSSFVGRGKRRVSSDFDRFDNTLAFIARIWFGVSVSFVYRLVQIPLCSAGLLDQSRQFTLPLDCTSSVVITV